MEFVTLEDGSEGLIIINKSFDNKLSYKFLDPFLSSDTIDIIKDINYIKKIIIKVKDSGRARLFGECLQNNEWKKTQNSVSFKYKIFSYKKLDNQDLALITRKGILIYTITEDFLGLRYFWNNEDWNEKFGFED